MIKTRQISAYAIVVIFLLVAGCSKSTSPPAASDASAVPPGQIFDKVAAAYKSLETYQSDGIITSEIDTGGSKTNTKTSFSILLKKPNLYLISWTQENMPMAGMNQSGAVWSDGTQPYLYMGIANAYSKMSSDEVALGGATGISGGAAFTIPSIFLPIFKNQPISFSKLIAPKIEKSEKVGKEECYVISGSSPISKREVFWISKASYLIKKYYRSLESPEGGVTMPEMTDEQLEAAIESIGEKVTDESKQKMRKMMEESKDVLKTTSMKGFSIELHADISTPSVTAEDFQFTPPKGSILKDSLFSSTLGNDK